METDANKAADTAGNPEPQKEPTAGTPNDTESGHAELMPALSPSLLEAPEKETPAVEIAKPQIPAAKTEDPLTQAANSLYAGNAVAEAQAAPVITPAPKTEASNTGTFARTIAPPERSAREIGLEGEPIREKAAPPELASLKQASVAPDGIPRVRTYANDISAEIRKRNTTLTSIVGAEQKRTLNEPAQDEGAERRRKIRGRLFLIGALFLLVAGAGTIGTVLFLRHAPGGVDAPRRSLIPVNHSIAIEYAGGEALPHLLAQAKDASTLSLGEAEELVVSENGAPLDASTLLTLLGAPNALARNATGAMVGVHAFDHNQPFLLVTVSAYDLAFQAMLSWETRMDEGLGDLFRPSSLAPSSITSSPPPLTFTDRTIQNIDIRESQPSWHIMYAFLRPDLIVITTNESTLREVITRLSLQSSK